MFFISSAISYLYFGAIFYISFWGKFKCAYSCVGREFDEYDCKDKL